MLETVTDRVASGRAGSVLIDCAGAAELCQETGYDAERMGVRLPWGVWQHSARVNAVMVCPYGRTNTAK